MHNCCLQPKKRKLENPDFEEFKNDITWFIKANDRVELLGMEENISLSNEFVSTFPKLTELVQQARILNLKINGQSFKLFSWTDIDDLSCGWLSKIEPESESGINISIEHKILLNGIGGIKESYNEPEPCLANNQNFLFLKSECTNGIGDWDYYYDDMCNEYQMSKIDSSDFISFVQEANGALTLYNPENNEVLLFSHDHSFDNVEFLENQPKYTFHRIKGVKSFTDYVEKLAEEWIAEIEL